MMMNDSDANAAADDDDGGDGEWQKWQKHKNTNLCTLAANAVLRSLFRI